MGRSVWDSRILNPIRNNTFHHKTTSNPAKKPAPFPISDSQARFQQRNRSEHSKPHISTRRRSKQAKNRLPEPVPCLRSRSSSRNLKEKHGDRIRNLAFLREIGENDSDWELQSSRSRRSP
ncbi:hypothetical protein AAC387_Pa10g1463 [Persea americana]